MMMKISPLANVGSGRLLDADDDENKSGWPTWVVDDYSTLMMMKISPLANVGSGRLLDADDDENKSGWPTWVVDDYSTSTRQW
jgi:hypothetical protein